MSEKRCRVWMLRGDALSNSDDWVEQSERSMVESVAVLMGGKLARETGRKVEVRELDGWIVAEFDGDNKHNRKVPGP